MPTYVYKCNDCQYLFEAQQSFSDPPLTVCPRCDEEELRRVINSVGVVFKGSGFYVTDSRNGKNGARTEKTEEKSETKSEKEQSEKPSSTSKEKKADDS